MLVSVQRHESVGVDLTTEHPAIPFPRNGNTLDVEMQCVLRENRRLRDDNDILKKPMDIFTNAQK